MSLVDWHAWLCRALIEHPRDERVLRQVLTARTAVGDGVLEERAIRLMVWCGAVLTHTAEHSGLKTPREILQDGRAWCDQQASVFCFLALHMLRVEDACLVSLKHTDPPTGAAREGHTVAEIYYTGDWHLFDVHHDHQSIYRDPHDGHVLSCDELRARPAIVAEHPHWWTPANGEGKEGFYRSHVKPVKTTLHDEWVWPWSPAP